MIQIADAKAGTVQDRDGVDLYIATIEETERLGYYGLRADGVEIRNPDYAVDAARIDD